MTTNVINEGSKNVKKFLILAVVVGLVASSLGAPAMAKKKKKPVRVERVVEFEYNCPCTGFFQLGSLTADGTNIGGGSVATGAEDVYLTAVAEDATGMPISVDFNQIGADGFNASMGSMCGETEEPIAVTSAGADINIFISGLDPACGVSGAGGTLTLTFSNLP